MKHEWKKHEKGLYGAKQIPTLIEVPKQLYIMITGSGNPNDKDFSDKVSALYSLAYAIKMEYKANSSSQEINDYTVYPLEGIWKQKEFTDGLDKSLLEYTIMIRQPDFVTKDMFSDALKRVKNKKPNSLYEQIRFDYMQDGKCIEILHIGTYDDEPKSFLKMDIFAKENDLIRIGNFHREIYLNNSNRVLKSKLKTILRYSVR
ncbi:MAG: GyrI-like domain-containing protein [Thomasclavelia spiroformis]|uniref:GyrI-like domain-containing protein n=1 Tax=Thomasclavelia spiroformis TaxID=29348 RepID=UPI003990DF0A